jgi:hypothetical protein
MPTSDNASDLADFLQSILRKENRSAYKLRDYLGLKAPAPVTGMLPMWQRPQPDFSRCSKSLSPHSMKRRRLGEWEMTAQCRWQIGQWFFKSEFSAKDPKIQEHELYRSIQTHCVLLDILFQWLKILIFRRNLQWLP